MPTLRLLASAYSLSNTSYLKITNPSNMYTDTDSTTYATVTHNRTSTTSYYIYVKGFDFTQINNLISQGATITSAIVKVKASVASAGSYTPSLYNNTTSITSTTFNGTITTTVNVRYKDVTSIFDTIKSYGTNLAIRLQLNRSSRNTASSMKIYGAEITIEYDLPTTTYSVSSKLTTSTGATGSIDPDGTETVLEGGSYTLSIYPDDPTTVVTVRDNSVDVTSSLVEHTIPSGGTVESNITSYSVSGTLSTATAFSNANGKGADASTTTSNGYCSTSGSTATVTYGFTLPDIPSNATITSVSCRVSGHAESSSNSNEHCDIQLYSGSTAKGTQKSFKSTGTTNTILTLDDGTWTRDELNDISLKVIVGYYGGAINGATLSVTYTTPGTEGKYYTYRLSSVSENHIIAVTMTKGVTDILYHKDNGQYIVTVKAYKKVNGVWVQQTDLTTVFNSETNYKKGN